MLRDHPQDPTVKKEALTLLSQAMGRLGTHYHFLSQRPQNPIQTEVQTGSGLLLGRVSGEGDKPYLQLKQELIPGDVLRIGYEDEPWHATLKISRGMSQGARFYLTPGGKKRPQQGAPVFLIDRREPDLSEKMAQLEAEITPSDNREILFSRFQAALPRIRFARLKAVDQKVFRLAPRSDQGREKIGLWLSPETFRNNLNNRDIWWWLPPAIWPEDEAEFNSLIIRLLQKGCVWFVLNAPWQIAFFRNPQKLSLWAGPFCNLGNPLSISQIKSYGFSGAIVSPELGQKDCLSLPRQSSLSLGIVVSGNWPLCISRILSDRLKTDRPFQSPKGEMAWASFSDSNYWIYPNWKLDLTAFHKELERAGYQLFVHLIESVPRFIKVKNRPGYWNWKINLQ
jgi:putative protease